MFIGAWYLPAVLETSARIRFVAPETISGILPSRHAVFDGHWSGNQYSRGEALFLVRAQIRAVHDNPILPSRYRSPKHDHRFARPANGLVIVNLIRSLAMAHSVMSIPFTPTARPEPTSTTAS